MLPRAAGTCEGRQHEAVTIADDDVVSTLGLESAPDQNVYRRSRLDLVHLAEDMIMADAAMAFTHHLIEYVAVRKEVKNFRMSPTPTWDFSHVTMG